MNINTNQVSQRKKNDLIEELKYLIKESVNEQLIADVPVGTFLSGGVDSSIVTYEGHKLNPQLECFSMGFSNTDYNELKYANSLAEKYNININSKIFNRSIFQNYYNNMKAWYDEPFADTSAFPTYMVSKLAKEKVAVVLTGDGGDEVFGGYDRQKAIWKKENEKGPDNLLISYLYSRFNKNKYNYYWTDELTFCLE